jgi:hypothetical protein
MIEFLLGLLVLAGGLSVVLGLGYIFEKMDSFPSTRRPKFWDCFESGLYMLVFLIVFGGLLFAIGMAAWAIGNGILN